MEARILKWQALSKDRKISVENFEEMQREIALKDVEKREIDRVNYHLLQIPMRFRGKSFYDYQVTCEKQGQIKLMAERFVETFSERIKDGTCMKFMGRPGTGKTLLSLIIYQSIIKKGFSVKYEPSTEFLKSLLEIKFQSQAIFNRYVESMRQYSFLIIDEVTESINKTGSISEIEKQVLFRIINDRYENRLCTIVITNRDEAGLIRCLGEPIMDRLSEVGISCAFNWGSYRK